jgi:hypothetical protein
VFCLRYGLNSEMLLNELRLQTVNAEQPTKLLTLVMEY